MDYSRPEPHVGVDLSLKVSNAPSSFIPVSALGLSGLASYSHPVLLEFRRGLRQAARRGAGGRGRVEEAELLGSRVFQTSEPLRLAKWES